MGSFPKTLIRCIAEDRTPDEQEISEIALHIWKDVTGGAISADARPHCCESLRSTALAALCGSRVPHLDEAHSNDERTDRNKVVRATQVLPGACIRRIMAARFAKAGDISEEARLLSYHRGPFEISR